MSPRLLILIAVVGLLAVYAALREPPTQPNVLMKMGETDRRTADTIDHMPLPGEEPEEPPEFDVRVEVDTSTGKNRLMFYISEAHGFYVEVPNLRVWYSHQGEFPESEDSPISFDNWRNRYIKAGETLTDCFEVVWGELKHVPGEDIGETGDWSARVMGHGRVRAENPETFPPISDLGRCD